MTSAGLHAYALTSFVVPVVQALSAEQGGPAWWAEDGGPERWPAVQAHLGGKAIDGRSPGRVLNLAPIAWRARWTKDGASVPWASGRPGDGWRSRVQVLGWLPSFGAAMVTLGGEATDDLLGSLRWHDANIYEEAERCGEPVPRFAVPLRLELQPLSPRGGRGARLGIVFGLPAGAAVPPALSVEALATIVAYLDRHGGPDAVRRWEESW